MSREESRNAVNELRAVIGGASLMDGLKNKFGVRHFHEISDDKMAEVEAWATAALAAKSKAKPDLNPQKIYARFNKRKAGVRIKKVAEGE